MLVSVACAVLTCLSALRTLSHGFSLVGMGNTLVSLTVIGLTSALILQSKAAESSLGRQAKLLDLTHNGIFTAISKGGSGPGTVVRGRSCTAGLRRRRSARSLSSC